ncbi:lipopolysaccharide biosynthesis protein [Eudoraea adriatica]|uniref:lipopolysaccharide biosynthesis protein n=1 Tax=Eudoraea adriatica TaxID=446681 RepID=UPI00037CC004|nr:lipopolysaccharide biosynthesis protein [Eudoraea adriatica]
MSLKQKTIYGFIWSAAEAILIKGISFIAMLILARWLGPADFGLIGMIAIFIGIGTSLVDSGMTSSLIRTQNAEDSDFSTVFYMNMAMSFLVYVLLFVSAPLIARFYEQEVLINVIRVYCLSFIISAFTAVQLAILKKEMKFKRLASINAPSTLIGVSVGLSLGYYKFGVWSIVAMFLTTQIILSLLLWFTASWKPSLNFSKQKLIYHYNFGYKIMLAGFLDTIFKNSYNVIIGKFFPVQTLGYYERAQRFNDYPSLTLTGIINQVTYPMLSKLQNDTTKLAEVYRRLLRLTFFVISPLMLGGAAIATPLFEIILGEIWLPAIPFFRILSVGAILYPVHAFNLNVLQVYGRSDLSLKTEIIKKVIWAFMIFIGFQFGLMGLVWSGVITSYICLPINMYYSSQLITYKIKTQILDLFPILVLAGCTFLIMYFSIDLLKGFSNILQIVGASIVGVLFYSLINSFFKKSPMFDLLNLIKNRKL